MFICKRNYTNLLDKITWRDNEIKRLNQEKDKIPGLPCDYCGKVTNHIPKWNIRYCAECQWSLSKGSIFPM